MIKLNLMRVISRGIVLPELCLMNKVLSYLLKRIVLCRWCWWGLGVALGLTSFQSQAQAQAWTQSQGNVYTKLSYGLSLAAEQFLFDGSTKNFFDGVDKGFVFQDSSFYLYTEAGLVDFFTMSLSLPYKRIYMEDNTFQYFTAAVGDIGVGFRFSIQHFAKIPKISALAINLNVTVPTGYTRNFFPPVGLGQTQLQLFLNYGQSFYPLPMYLQVGAGYQTRLPFRYASGKVACGSGEPGCLPEGSDNPEMAHELAFSVELGYIPIKWLFFQALVQGVMSFVSPKAGVTPVGAAPPPAQRFLKAGGAMTIYPFATIKSLAKLGFGAQFMGTLWGQATNRALEFQFGIEYQVNFKMLGK